MRVLLDESLPRSLTRHLSGVTAETVFDRGWSGLSNGELLRSAAGQFEVFITADQNLQYQQNLEGYEIGVIVLSAVSNRLEDLVPLLPSALEQCRHVQAGEVIAIRSPSPAGLQ